MVVVPPYCRSRSGKVFRVTRSSAVVDGRVRYALRATPINPDAAGDAIEAARELDLEQVRDKIANGQAVPSPESTFEDLLAQLRIDLDLRYT